MHRLWIALIALAWGSLHAGEGMWLPEQLPKLEQDLKATGLEIDPEGRASWDFDVPPGSGKPRAPRPPTLYVDFDDGRLERGGPGGARRRSAGRG